MLPTILLLRNMGETAVNEPEPVEPAVSVDSAGDFREIDCKYCGNIV